MIRGNIVGVLMEYEKDDNGPDEERPTLT